MTSIITNTLDARVKKILSSRTEIESTKSLLNSLVTNHNHLTIDTLSPSSTQTISLSDFIDILQPSLEEKQYTVANDALNTLTTTLNHIQELKSHINELHRQCHSIQSFLQTTKEETMQVQLEASMLQKKKSHVNQELYETEKFLAKYQLTTEEVHGLYHLDLNMETELETFVDIMERTKQVRLDCKTLVSQNTVDCSLELLELVSKYQAVGFERLYKWSSKMNTEAEGESSLLIQRAIALLQDHAELYKFSQELL